MIWKLLILYLLVIVGSPVYASITEGTIDTTYRYAWSENLGWIDFGSDEGNVGVTDTELSGHAYGESVGWILLNCDETDSCGDVDYKVSNNNEGVLSGYAWGENIGWVAFNPPNGGVTINNEGIFFGHAWNETTGWIIFNCDETDSCGDVNYYVATDWRPQSVRPACNNSIDDDSDGNIDFPDDTDCLSLEGTNEENINSPSSKSGGRRDSLLEYKESNKLLKMENTDLLVNIFSNTSSLLSRLNNGSKLYNSEILYKYPNSELEASVINAIPQKTEQQSARRPDSVIPTNIPFFLAFVVLFITKFILMRLR